MRQRCRFPNPAAARSNGTNSWQNISPSGLQTARRLADRHRAREVRLLQGHAEAAALMPAPARSCAVLEGLRDRHSAGTRSLEGEQDDRSGEKDGANVSRWNRAAQLELSGAPLETIHQTCDEVNTHLREVKDIADKIGVGFIGLGAAPHLEPRGDAADAQGPLQADGQPTCRRSAPWAG